MRKTLFIAALIGVAGFITQCQKVEKIEKAGSITPKIIANCVVEDGTPFIFIISKSLSALDNAQLKPLKSAVVELSDSKGNKETIKYSAIDEAYISTEVAQAGQFYTIKITAPGLKTVTSQMTLPANLKTNAGAVSIKGKTTEDFGSYRYISCQSAGFSVSITDEPAEKNNYIFEIEAIYASGNAGDPYWNWSCLYPTIERVNPYDNFSSNFKLRFYLRDDLFNGQKIDLNFSADGRISGFGSGLYLGNQDDSIVGFNVIVRNVPDDLYLHWNSVDKAQESEGNPFEEPVQIYTNILGGYGIFSGYRKEELYLPLP